MNFFFLIFEAPVQTRSFKHISVKPLVGEESSNQNILFEKSATESSVFNLDEQILAAKLLAMAAKNTKTETDTKDDIDAFIYEMVDDEKKGAIRDKYETTVLKALTLKSKLDLKIDETFLALQNLKNLRRHIETAFTFTNRFVNNKATSDDIKHYVLKQLENAIGQVDKTLKKVHSHDDSDSDSGV